jgi:ABC-type uncharacterized transport system permease subunit
VIHLGHEVAAAAYLAAAVLGWLAVRRPALGRGVSWLIALGVATHTLGFVSFHRVDPPVQLDSFPAAVSLIGWLTATAYLLSLGVARVRAVGAWVAAAALASTVAADLGLRLLAPGSPPTREAGAWSHAHVLLSAAGFSLLALSSVGGLAYLAKQRALKSKHAAPRRGLALPSLESLDRVEHLGLVLGFPLLTLGVVSGFVWVAREGTPLWTGHAVFLAGAWVVYLIPITLRVIRGQRGRIAARSVVWGFFVLAAAYLGVRLVGAAA